jgi:hypothetical protein
MEMNKYAKWMSDNNATIHVSGYSGPSGSGKIAYVYDAATCEKWAEGKGGEPNDAILAAIKNANDSARPLHAEPSAENIALKQQLADLKRELELAKIGASAPASPKPAVVDESGESEMDAGPSIKVKDAIARKK